jgi:hypothetical protein
MVASVGSAPSISRAGAGACTTPSSHWRQAYFGRIVTSTRNRAGTISSRSLLSSPIRCNAPWQQRQVLSSMSMVVTIRGRCAGSAPRLARRFAAPACRAAGVACSASAASRAAACSTSSKPSCIWSSGSVSARRPNWWRCRSLMI